jgi:hypothetical protein
MPATQQFYLQNRFQVENYFLMDFFFNFRIKRLVATTKISNTLLGLVGKGYFASPVYLQQPRAFEVVINWLFFD